MHESPEWFEPTTPAQPCEPEDMHWQDLAAWIEQSLAISEELKQ